MAGQGIEGTGAQAVAAMPWLAEVSPSALLRAALAASPDYAGLPPLLSLKWRLKLEAACRRLDTYGYGVIPPASQGGRGAGAAAIIDMVAGDWREEWRHSRGAVAAGPYSAGLFAVCVRRVANANRRAAAARDGRATRRRKPTRLRQAAEASS